jgi:capsular polysaccharide biosynthesis protein
MDNHGDQALSAALTGAITSDVTDPAQSAPPPLKINRLVDFSYFAEHEPRADVAVTELAPAALMPMPPPTFLAGDASHVLLDHIYGPVATDAVRCLTIDGGYVAPTGFGVAADIALFSETTMQPAHHVRHIVGALLGSDLPRRYIAGKLAPIYGPAHQTWGHWICDYLPRLHLLTQAGHDLADIRFVMPPDLKAFAADLLTRIGIGPGQIVTYAYGKEILHAGQVLLTTGFRTEDALAAGFEAATEFWQARMGFVRGIQPGRRKIFLSRAGASGERIVTNRQHLEAMAKNRGYEILHPETLSIDAQIDVYANAHSIIGEYGSALHNSVFAPRGVRICALRGTSRHPGFVQTSLCHAMGQKMGYVLGNSEHQNIEQRFRIEPSLFERALTWLEN